MANKPKAKPGRKSEIEKQLEQLQNGLDKALRDNEELRNQIEFQKGAISAASEIISEQVTPLQNGGAVGIAIRTAETKESIRMLVTIRAGFSPEKIQFNFGSYAGPQTKDGGGEPIPPCP